MNIIITAENAAELEAFVPVVGSWRIDGDRAESVSEVAESIHNWMDPEFPMSVTVFHADGRDITGDVPSEGTYVAVRELPPRSLPRVNPPDGFNPLAHGGRQKIAAQLAKAAGFCASGDIDHAHDMALLAIHGLSVILHERRADAAGIVRPLGGTCPTCGKQNAIVNACRCDPNNLPTTLP